MTEKISSLRDSKTARWFVLILVSFTMMCMYYLTDAMAPLQDKLQQNLHWTATEYGFFTSGYGWFNVFLLMLVFSGMILDKLGTRITGVLAICVMLIGEIEEEKAGYERKIKNKTQDHADLVVKIEKWEAEKKAIKKRKKDDKLLNSLNQCIGECDTEIEKLTKQLLPISSIS